MPDFFDNVGRLSLTATGTPVPVRAARPMSRECGRRVQGEFVKGPLPLAWLTIASMLKGKSPLTVGLALWFEAGRRRAMTVTLTTAILARFGVKDRKAKYRGLSSLENAGLIMVQRIPRRNPIVTILEARKLSSEGVRQQQHQP